MNELQGSVRKGVAGQDARFDRIAISFPKVARMVFFLRSLAAFSCLILDHLLWPLWRGRLVRKERRHWAQIWEAVFEWNGRRRALVVRVREAIVAFVGCFNRRV